MEPPSHPQTGETGDRDDRSTVNWGLVITITVLALVLAAVVILHLTGVVGPRGH